MSELCEVVITAPDPDWLYSFARSLVEDGLAASAHNSTPVRSIYRWQGRVHERIEGRVALRTRPRPGPADRAPRQTRASLRGARRVAVPIIDGGPDYLAWIAKETDAASTGMHGPTT